MLASFRLTKALSAPGLVFSHPNFMLIVHDVVEPIIEASPRPSLDTSKHVKGYAPADDENWDKLLTPSHNFVLMVEKGKEGNVVAPPRLGWDDDDDLALESLSEVLEQVGLDEANQINQARAAAAAAPAAPAAPARGQKRQRR